MGVGGGWGWVALHENARKGNLSRTSCVFLRAGKGLMKHFDAVYFCLPDRISQTCRFFVVVFNHPIMAAVPSKK